VSQFNHRNQRLPGKGDDKFIILIQTPAVKEISLGLFLDLLWCPRNRGTIARKKNDSCN
jgi:hypothetical protein